MRGTVRLLDDVTLLAVLSVLTRLTVAPGAIAVMVAVWFMLVWVVPAAAAAVAMSKVQSATAQIGMRW
jgi:hypothetical protein